MVSPALAQFPRAGDALCDVSRALTGWTSEATQGISCSIGEHRAKRLVALSHLGHGDLQITELSVGCAINCAEAELHTKIQQELVTARGHALNQGLDGISGTHLIWANLGPDSDEHFSGIRRSEADVIWARAAGGRGCSCNRGWGCWGFRSFCRSCWGLFNRHFTHNLIGSEHNWAIALNV